VAPVGRPSLAPDRVTTGGPLSSENEWPPFGRKRLAPYGRKRVAYYRAATDKPISNRRWPPGRRPTRGCAPALEGLARWGEAIVQIGAVTGDPVRDLEDEILDEARTRLRGAHVEADASRPLYEVVTPTFADTSRAFGELLPNGLRLNDPGT